MSAYMFRSFLLKINSPAAGFCTLVYSKWLKDTSGIPFFGVQVF
jgi:hypothetical protein